MENLQFINYLKEGNLQKIMMIEKTDLHVHSTTGGKLTYLGECSLITNIPDSFDSINDMEFWINVNLKKNISWLSLIKATLRQAKADNIKILILSFPYDTILSITSLSKFIDIFTILSNKIAPETMIIPEISLKWDVNVNSAYYSLEKIYQYNWFKFIDISGRELTQPLNNFVKLYEQAQVYCLYKRMHIGEFGSSEAVLEAIYTLGINEINHGIAIANNKQVMEKIKENNISINICVSSNLKLGVVKSIEEHPIDILFRNNLDIAICTDDSLLFDTTVSEEYLKLYESKKLTAEEINDIRINGLNRIKKYSGIISKRSVNG